MTAVDTPTFIQAGGENAEETRRSLGAVLSLRGGIIGSTDLAVTQNSPTGMSVIVAGGQVVIPGTEGTYQGFYVCENRGNEVVTIAPSDPTNARIDLIVARVRDAAYSGAVNTFTLEAVTGSAAGLPAYPTVPDNCWVLARVDVAAAATTVITANITDIRTGLSGFTDQNGRAAALGGVVVCSSSLRPTTGLYDGFIAYEANTNRLIFYTGSAWEYVMGGGWTVLSYSNNWTDFGSGFQVGQYRKVGDVVYVRGLLKRSTGTPSVGETVATLPSGFRPPTDITNVAQEAAGVSSFSRIDVTTAGIIKWVTGTAASAASALTLDIVLSTV